MKRKKQSDAREQTTDWSKVLDDLALAVAYWHEFGKQHDRREQEKRREWKRLGWTQ